MRGNLPMMIPFGGSTHQFRQSIGTGAMNGLRSSNNEHLSQQVNVLQRLTLLLVIVLNDSINEDAQELKTKKRTKKKN